MSLTRSKQTIPSSLAFSRLEMVSSLSCFKALFSLITDCKIKTSIAETTLVNIDMNMPIIVILSFPLCRYRGGLFESLRTSLALIVPVSSTVILNFFVLPYVEDLTVKPSVLIKVNSPFPAVVDVLPLLCIA